MINIKGMIQIRILGSTVLNKEGAPFNSSLLAGPKRLGLLVYLLLARPRGFHRRDKLTALFWPEKSQKSARNALSNMLYHIRNSLGKEVVINRGNEEICLNTDSIECDVLAFEKAVKQKKFRQAIDHYRGDLLTAFHVSEVSNNFSSWVEANRNRLRQMAFETSWKLAEKAEQTAKTDEARHWAEKALSYADSSEEAHKNLITLLNRLGVRTEALKVYERFCRQLRNKWDMEPSEELQQLYKKLRSQYQQNISDSAKQLSHTPYERTVAVLPFENLGPEKSVLCNGIHGDIVTRLSEVRDLRVISRTSVKKYAQTHQSLKEIASELKVAYVMEGEVLETDQKVRVNVRLIKSETDTQVWGKDFLRNLTAHNLFDIQSQITKQIATTLQAQLTPKEQNRVEASHTDHIDAYRLYMQGWSWIERRTEKGLRRGLNYFRQAAEIDSQFDLALIGQAYALLGLHGYGYEEPSDVLPEAANLIEKVLETHPGLAEAHSALGLYYTSKQDGPKAVEELQKAVTLRPGYANAHNKLSWIYQLLGETVPALQSARQAVKLDPFSPEAVVNLAYSLLINGEIKPALQKINEAYKLQPGWATIALYKALILYQLEQFSEAQKYLQNLTVPWTRNGPELLLSLIKAKQDNRRCIQQKLEVFKQQRDFFSAGILMAAIGQTQKAVESLSRVDHWTPWPTQLIYHLFQDELKEVKTYPEFNRVLQKLETSWKVFG